MAQQNIAWDGQGSLQTFLDGLPADQTEITVQLPAVTIRERIVLARPYTCLQGQGAGRTVITYACGAREILPDGFKRGTFRTATLRTDGDHIRLRGLTIENSAAPTEDVGQAIALYAEGDDLLVEDCALIGAQDTLFTAPLPPREVEPRGFIGPKEFAPRRSNRQRYLRCAITGSIDFIFGGAAAWFEDCALTIRDARRDQRQPCAFYVAAPSTPQGQRYGYLFHHCSIHGENVPDGSVCLARPWREYAKAWFVDCTADACLNPEGYAEWSGRIIAGNTDFTDDGLMDETQRLPGTRKLRSTEVPSMEDFMSAAI